MATRSSLNRRIGQSIQNLKRAGNSRQKELNKSSDNISLSADIISQKTRNLDLRPNFSRLKQFFGSAERKARNLGDRRRGDRLEQLGKENKLARDKLDLGRDTLTQDTRIRQGDLNLRGELGRAKIKTTRQLGNRELDIRQELGQSSIGVDRQKANTLADRLKFDTRRFDTNLEEFRKLEKGKKNSSRSRLQDSLNRKKKITLPGKEKTSQIVFPLTSTSNKLRRELS